MTESTVKVSMRDENNLDCSYAVITKDKISIIIILKDKECGIFNYDDLKSQEGSFHYLLLKHYGSPSFAYRDFLKLIGKMCKKKGDSKYFSNPKQEDNRMIFEDFDHEHMLSVEEKTRYEARFSEFRRFVLRTIPSIKL